VCLLKETKILNTAFTINNCHSYVIGNKSNANIQLSGYYNYIIDAAAKAGLNGFTCGVCKTYLNIYVVEKRKIIISLRVCN